MSDDAAGFVGSIPETYDRGLGPIIFTEYDEYTARLVASYAPSRVLETGAGTGIVTRRLRDLLPATTRLIATDLNPPMLDVARKKFRPDEAIEFQHADAMALPFADASFDAVVCQFGVMFFPDKEKSYREAYRVLAPGGRYVFSVWDGGYNRMRHGSIADEVAAQFFPTDPPQFYCVTGSYNKIDPIKESLSDAGFIDLRIAVLTREKQVANIGAFARAMVYGNPLIDMIRTRGGVDPDQVVNALGEAFAREFGNPARLPQRAILFEAIRP
jgi:ubiquinone/menaquinone biosynthesis C-methylase UbiE